MNQNSFKTFKERGEWVELCFMTRALEHGYKISKPWGYSSPYDVGVSMREIAFNFTLEGAPFNLRDEQ